MFSVIVPLTINDNVISGNSNEFVMIAKASILMNCKIQTMSVQTNISVSFTPPEVMNEDCVKLLYYQHQNFAMCQRVVDIRMNEGNQNSNKQMDPNFSESFIQKLHWELFRNFFLVYRYDYSHGIHEVGIYTSLSVLQKFERFFEKIPHDSAIAFILNLGNATFVDIFVKALLRLLGRFPPIDAKHDQDKVQAWLSNNKAITDLITYPSTLWNVKTKFIINLSSNMINDTSKEQIFGTGNATSQYTHICLPTPSPDELKAMMFFSSEKHKQSNEACSIHNNNMQKYLSK